MRRARGRHGQCKGCQAALAHVPQCPACKRSLQMRHAFTLGNQLYCGSCAPEGSAPYDTTLARAIPSMDTSAGLGRRAWEVDPLTAAVNWLFSKMKG